VFAMDNLNLLNKMEPFNKYTGNWGKFFAEQIQKGNI
jgi:hypothetical protein